MKHCKHGIDLLLLCDIGDLQLIFFQVEGLHENRMCSLKAVPGCSLLALGRFRSFLAHVGRFISFLALCRLFHVVSVRFLLVKGSFR